ncbi:unnamed protein product [Bursaphelenchus xylophilus]|uniref:(pine wood nematode) hypothetical protein n=1 Tax=Bursaphelenchus xylophilus TaxID=6326 RepID=A0A811K697_BURXY|nr:unnamed protein product [Bursaphelenchus xylophilus]CAG9087454.1 unnamed protein product [Bursaphelenchus xylophilus]
MRICLDELELIPSVCIVQSKLIIMDNIRFDTSLMRRIFLMLHLEASGKYSKCDAQIFFKLCTHVGYGLHINS